MTVHGFGQSVCQGIDYWFFVKIYGFANWQDAQFFGGSDSTRNIWNQV